MKTVRQFLEAAAASSSGSDTPHLDAQVLLAHVLDRPRSWVLAHTEAALTSEQGHLLENSLKQLENGLPLPYVLGRWEFFGLEFAVTPDVLIPRPETELLVEHALDWLGAHPHARRAADIGTGSGCIAVSLAVHCPDLRLVAGDVSATALQVARSNAARHGVGGRIEFVQADLLPETEYPFDLVAANLPYIPSADLPGLAVSGREPALALDGGPDGLAYIRRLLQQVRPGLSDPGLILLEIEASQGPAVLNMAAAFFPHAEASLSRDLAGKDRLVEIRF